MKPMIFRAKEQEGNTTKEHLAPFLRILHSWGICWPGAPSSEETLSRSPPPPHPPLPAPSQQVFIRRASASHPTSDSQPRLTPHHTGGMSGSPPCPEGTDAATPTRDSPAGDASSPPLTGSTGEEGLEVASVDGEGLACGGCDPAEPTPEGEGDGSVEERPSAGLEGGHAAAPEEEADVVPTQRPEPGAPTWRLCPRGPPVAWRGPRDGQRDRGLPGVRRQLREPALDSAEWVVLKSAPFGIASRGRRVTGCTKGGARTGPCRMCGATPPKSAAGTVVIGTSRRRPTPTTQGGSMPSASQAPTRRKKGSACFVRRRAWKRCARVQTEFAGACPQG